MRKFTRIQKRLLTTIVVLCILACAMFGLRQNSITNIGYSVWTYLKYGLIQYPLSSIGNAVNDFANLWHAYDDNEYLSKQLAEQKNYQTAYEDERNKNKQLEGLLEMKGGFGDAKTISVSVLERSSDSWLQTVTISAGKKQGVEKNMLVATSDGAIGLVESVQTKTSIVQLLTSQHLSNDIAIKMSLEDGTSVEGVLQSYDTEKKAYRVSLFDNDAIVTKGQKVATSGKGGNYPSGILIGEVKDVSLNDDSIISTVYVSPVSNMKSFDYCLVIGKEESK
ncbi:rod shape-determining protein MreC [Holdemanella porci]|uniref:rod shape-determining protein MreC n=1 Tax=Holdemanella porci TaxID=2652276 RepID=UPI003F88824E